MTFYDSVGPDVNQGQENKLVRKSLTKYPEPFLSGLKLSEDVEINGLVLNKIDDNGVVWVVSEIEGWWNLPDLEIPELSRGWGDGSYDASGRYADRSIILSGSFLPQEPSQVPAARSALFAAFNLVKTGGWLLVHEDKNSDVSSIEFPTSPEDGDEYVPSSSNSITWIYSSSEELWVPSAKATYVRIIERPTVLNSSPRGRHDFTAPMKAVDPVKYEWYSPDPEGYKTTNVVANTLTTGSLYEGSISIDNTGDTPVPIVIELPKNFTIVDQNNLPYIYNADSDQRITIVSGTATGKSLEIDTYNREALEVTYITREISNVVTDGSIATYTTAQNHGLSVGDIVEVYGVTPEALNTNRVEIISKTDNTFSIASSSEESYVSGGSVDVVSVVENGRSKVSVLVDWIYLNPGSNSIEIYNFPQDSEIRVYHRSGWIS